LKAQGNLPELPQVEDSFEGDDFQRTLTTCMSHEPADRPGIQELLLDVVVQLQAQQDPTLGFADADEPEDADEADDGVEDDEFLDY
jgi:hypothetical protein